MSKKTKKAEEVKTEKTINAEQATKAEEVKVEEVKAEEVKAEETINAEQTTKAEEVAQTEKPIAKASAAKKIYGYVVTGLTCAAVSIGVMLGADVSKVQETLNKAQAQQLAIIAATYSAEQILTKVTVVAGNESKAQAIKEVVAQVVVSMPEFMEAVTAVKTTVKDTVNIVTDTKKKVEEVKASTETKTDTTVKK